VIGRSRSERASSVSFEFTTSFFFTVSPKKVEMQSGESGCPCGFL
jgi:hypothetical protein